ncbi:MAG: FAD-dependent oxidoreductase [Anaerolineae bacterium]
MMYTDADFRAHIPGSSGAYQVVVAGGGPAGLGAALAAARQGASTLLLEARSFFGGVAGVALWMPMNRMLLEGGSRGGVHDMLVSKLTGYGADAWIPGRENWINGDGIDVHPEYLRMAAFEALEEAGCHYRLYSPVTDVVMDGDRITGVVTSAKEGQQNYKADVVVDATGDGDVAFRAGAEMVQGREEDGRSMPVSLVFAVANADTERLIAYADTHHGELEAIYGKAHQAGFAVAAWYAYDRTTVPGVVTVNNGGWRGAENIDATRSGDLTAAERMGMQVAVDFVRLARLYRIPGLENCLLARAGAAVGVRDTRRLVGEYVVTVEDARNGAEFPDVIARKYGAIDANQLYTGPMQSGFAYPYRALLPRRIEGLLVAGRCGSATFLGHAAGKSMGNMMALGQAAGVAAALASQSQVTPRALPVEQVQWALEQMGVRLAPPEAAR